MVERWANSDPRLKEILDDAKRDFNNVLKNSLFAPMADKTINPFGTADIREATLLSNNIKWALEHDSEDQRFTPRVNVKNEVTGTIVVEALARFESGIVPAPRPAIGGRVITADYAEINEEFDEARELLVPPPLPNTSAGKPLPLPPIPLPLVRR